MIPFGTQYYRPPTPKPEFWKADFKLMKECGFNTIRVWAVWSWLNHKKGIYDFNEIEQLLEIADKYDIKVILLINIESSPGWLFKSHPDKLYVDRLGNQVEPHTVHNTSIGGFPGQCLDYPEIKEAAEEFIIKLVKCFRNHSALLAWEPHNEPLIEPARYNHEIFCYCRKTIELYRDWLNKKYGSIEKLNDVWKRKFSNFDEVYPPKNFGSYADWMDWRNFAIDNMIAQETWRIELIRKYDPNHQVFLHSRAGGDRRDIVCDGTDDWRLARLVDKFGYANFPQGKTIFEHILSGDICRSAAQGKEFWLHELQSGPFGIGLNRNNPFFLISGDNDFALNQLEIGSVTPDRLALWSILPFSQGAKGLLYWQFRTEQYGTENGFNLVGLDGNPLPRLEMAKNIANLFKENEEVIAKAKPPDSKIAIGYSIPSAMMSYFSEGEISSYMSSYLGANRVLQHSGNQIDVVKIDDTDNKNNLSRYEVVVLPFPIYSDDKTAEELKRFVAGGGILISEASFAQFDNTYFSSDRVPGMGLDEVFGCHREVINSKGELKINYKGLAIKSRFYEEYLIPHEGAEIAAFYENGEPACIINHYGNGKSIYFGTNIFMDYIFNEDENLLSVISDLTNGVYKYSWTNNKLAITRMIQSDNAKLVFLFNGYYENICCTLHLDEEVKQAYDIFNKEIVNFDVYKGTSKKFFYLKPYDVKIFKI